MECRLEHVLSPDILDGLTIRAGTRLLAWNREQRGGALWLTAIVPADCIEPRGSVCLQFQVPRTLSPAVISPACEDARHLGIALSCIRLRPAAAALAEVA